MADRDEFDPYKATGSTYDEILDDVRRRQDNRRSRGEPVGPVQAEEIANEVADRRGVDRPQTVTKSKLEAQPGAGRRTAPKKGRVKAEPRLGKDACVQGVLEAAARMGLEPEQTNQIREAMEGVEARRQLQGEIDTLEDGYISKAGELANAALKDAVQKDRVKKLYALKRSTILSLSDVAQAAHGDRSLGVEARISGVNRPFAGSRDSAQNFMGQLEGQWVGGMITDLKREGVFAHYTSKAYSDDVVREMWAMSMKGAVKGLSVTGSDIAYKIAKILHKYERASALEQNRQGAYITLAQKRAVTNTNDVGKLNRAGMEAWIRDVLDGRLFDFEAMEIAPGREREFLISAYDAVTTGVRLDSETSGRPGFSFSNLADRASASRTFIFRDADAWLTYNKKYGSSDVNEAVISSLRRGAQNAALLKYFGPRPRALFDDVRHELRQRVRREGGDKRAMDRQLRRLGKGSFGDRLDAQFKELDGTVNAPGSISWAYRFQIARSTISAAKLGMAVFSSVADLANVYNTRYVQTKSHYVGLRDSIAASWEGFSAGEKRAMADMWGVGLDTMLGDISSRMGAHDDLPGVSNKLMAKFFRLNLLGPWTDAVKRAATYMLARDMGRLSKTSWAMLTGGYPDLLRKYGIGEAEWKIARKGALEIGGSTYLSPDRILELADQAKGQQTQRRYREVAALLRGMYVDQADFASPTPGIREKAIMRQGLAPGTLWGEVARSMTQFKAFPITVLTRSIGSRVYGGQKPEIVGIAAFLAYSTILGILALELKEVAKMRSPRFTGVEELGDAQFRALFVAGMLQGGGAGIFGDFFFGDQNRFGGGPIATVAGPLFGEVEKLIKIGNRAILGPLTAEDGTELRDAYDDAGAGLAKFAVYNAPGANLFYVQPILKTLFWDQLFEILNPGYLRRAEQRMRREQRQEPLRYVPGMGEIKSPADAIPYGGGERIFEGIRD